MADHAASCTKCGTRLSSKGLGGLCPKCVARAAVAPAAPFPSSLEDQPAEARRIRYFGDYELLEEIARGGMGIVYKARQVSLNRIVAVKMILSGALASEADVQRFRAEAEAAANLHHPNIVSIYEIGDDGGQRYFSMEYIEGKDLSRLVREHPLPPRRAAEHVKKIAEAIEYAHQHGTLHRDLKPSNVLIDESGEPHVTDFGLAKRLTNSELGTRNPELTLTGQVLGTPSFMSPEQAAGRRNEMAAASDIYSLGAILYYLLTGRPPFAAETLEETLRQVMALEPAPPRLLNANTPRDLETICLKCLAKEPPRRYATAGGLAEDLGRFLHGEPILARPVTKVECAWRWCRRKPAVALALAACGAAVVASVGFGLQRQRSADEAQLGKLKEAQLKRISHLRQAQLERIGNHLSGWSSKNWGTLIAAQESGVDEELLAQAAAGLAGLDTKPVRIFRDVQGSSVAFARDGRLLVGGVGTNRSIIIGTNGIREELAADRTGPVCWTEEGVPLQFVTGESAMGGGAYVLRDAATKHTRQVFTLAPGEKPMPSSIDPLLAISPDASRVAAALVRGTNAAVVVWDAATGAPLGEANLTATALAFTPDGQSLAVGGMDGMVTVCSIPGLRAGTVLRAGTRRGSILALAFTADRVVRYDTNSAEARWLLAAGDHDGGLIIWDVTAGVPRSSCIGSEHVVLSAAFHPDGLTLASAGRNEARLWDVQSGRSLLQVHELSSDASRALAFSRDGKRFAWCNRAGFGPAEVGLWELEPHRGILALRGLSANVRQVWFAPNSRFVAAVADAWLAGIWELPSGNLKWLIEVPKGVLADNCDGVFDAAATRFAFATEREARLYDLATGKMVRTWELERGLADRLQFDGAGRLLLLRREKVPVSSYSIAQWKLYELPLEGGPKLLLQQTDTSRVAYIFQLPAGGKVLLAKTHDRSFSNWRTHAIRVADGAEVFKRDCPEGDRYIPVDPTGRWFSTSILGEAGAHIFSTTDFTEVEYLTERCVALSPSRRQFAVGNRVVNRNEPGSELTFGLDWQPRGFPAFSPDETYYAQGTTEGLVLVADLPEVRRRLKTLIARR